MLVADSAAAASEPEEAYEVEVRKKFRPPHPHPSAARLHSTYWPPSSSASRTVMRGPAGIPVARAQAQAAQVAEVRTGSVQELVRLAGERCEAAMALQHWRPGRVDEGDGGGGVSGLRRW
jgi:hypothetical protein